MEYTPNEKSILKHELINSPKKEYINNVGEYLSNSFNKINGFDYKWNSLITSNPLLFEDVDYLRVRQYVKNTITPEEVENYKSGNLRELYGTFENMLVCNLAYYDRIMNFCTMIFLHYVRLSDDEITTDNLDDVPFSFEMTPTQVWCCALTGQKSSEWELSYGWGKNFSTEKTFHKSFPQQLITQNSDLSILELNWKSLYLSNKAFSRFMEFCALRCGTNGFRQTLVADKTSNRKLAKVCQKFTRTSTAITEDQLNTMIEYIHEIDSINSRLYTALFHSLKRLFGGDETQFSIFVFTYDFYIHTSKFSMKVSRNEIGKITKDYLANSYECFAAEEYLFETIKLQIEWAKYKLPIQFDYDKQVLTNILTEMLKLNYKDTLCIRRMNNFGMLAKISFYGVFNNVYINEELMFDNKTIRSSKVCLSKDNAAKYVIDRGYYIIGTEVDVYKFTTVNKSTLTAHYQNYCVTVLQHMSSVIQLHNLSKNDIIDVICSGIINPNKLNNQNIKYTTMRTINPKEIMLKIDNNKVQTKEDKKSYWKTIE